MSLNFLSTFLLQVHIYKTELNKMNPKNIQWIHHNPYHFKENPDHIKTFNQIIPYFDNGTIIDASWQQIYFLPN